MKISARYTPNVRRYIFIASLVAMVLNYFFFISVETPEMDYETIEFYQEYPTLAMISQVTTTGLYWLFTVLPFAGLIIVAIYKPTAKPERQFRKINRP